jgi:hypothetical protein
MTSSNDLWLPSIFGLLATILSSSWTAWSLFTIISVVGIAPQLGVAVMCGVVGNLLALPAFLA